MANGNGNGQEPSASAILDKAIEEVFGKDVPTGGGPTGGGGGQPINPAAVSAAILSGLGGTASSPGNPLVRGVDPNTGRPILGTRPALRGFTNTIDFARDAGGFVPVGVGPGTLGTPVDTRAARTAAFVGMAKNLARVMEQIREGQQAKGGKGKKRKPVADLGGVNIDESIAKIAPELMRTIQGG